MKITCLTQESPSIVEPLACELSGWNNVSTVDVFYHSYWQVDDLQDKDVLVLIPQPDQILLVQDMLEFHDVITNLYCKNKIVIILCLEVENQISDTTLNYLDHLRCTAQRQGARAHLHYGELSTLNDALQSLMRALKHKQQASKRQRIRSHSLTTNLISRFWSTAK